MEQLKPIIKYHFWILCGVIVLTTIGAGFWAMSGQAGTIAKQETQIKSAKSSATGVMSVSADVGEGASVSVHPNEETNKGMLTEISEGKAEVMAAWQKLYDEQKDLLDWPMNALPEDIARVFQPFRAERMPFELKNEELEAPLNRRKQVKLMLHSVLPKLAEQIRAKWEVVDEVEEASSDDKNLVSTDESPMESQMFNQPITEWSVADQEQWYSEFTIFNGRNGNDDPLDTPTTMQVLYAKENLVLLNGILEILKKVNEDATTPGQATVKTIQSIMIGNSATTAKPLNLAAMSGGGSNPMDERMAQMKDYMSNRSNKPGDESTAAAGPTGSALEALDPANNRYVNEKFEPIPSAEYRAAITSTTLSDKSWMSIFKRVPVRLTLKIDERNIDDLLEACANGKIPFEVRQVTMVGGNIPGADSAAGGGSVGPTGRKRSVTSVGAGGPGGAGDSSMSLDGAESARTAGKQGGSDLKTSNYNTAEFNTNFDVPVELYGFMKIYNEPVPEAIGAGDKATAVTANN